MGSAAIHLANAPTVHFNMESFQVAAQSELNAHPLVQAGICQNPICSAHFAPTRGWQTYCSAACRRAGEAEMRWIGCKAAPALLAWRMGKYEQNDEALRALSRAGRNYVSRLSSRWFEDRMQRALDRRKYAAE